MRAAVTGDTADLWLTQNYRLRNSLQAALMAAGTPDQVARQIGDTVFNAELKRRFPEGVPKWINSQMKFTKGAPYQEAYEGLRLLVQRLKNSTFGLLDFGAFGVNGLVAVARGGVPMMAGVSNRMLAALQLPHIDVYQMNAGAGLAAEVRRNLDGVSRYSRRSVNASGRRT
jgi:hypothetical protein